MANGNVPLVPETPIIPPVWDVLTPAQFKVKIAAIDDLGLPFDPRGMVVTVPYKTQHKEFAAAVGKQVENTILHSLGHELEEENNG